MHIIIIIIETVIISIMSMNVPVNLIIISPAIAVLVVSCVKSALCRFGLIKNTDLTQRTYLDLQQSSVFDPDSTATGVNVHGFGAFC